MKLTPSTVTFNPAIPGAIGGTTPAAGTFTALVGTTINGNTFTTGTGVLTIAASKTLTASNTLTLTGTDSSSVECGAGGTIAYLGTAQTFTQDQVYAAGKNLKVFSCQGTPGTSLVGGFFFSGNGTYRNWLFCSDNFAGNDFGFFVSATTSAGSNPGFPIMYFDAASNRTSIGHNAATQPSGTKTLNVEGTLDVTGATTTGGNITITSGNVVFSTSGKGIAGTTTNDNAAALNVGEYVSASVVQGSATALTTATPKTVTSISLTAGDWDVTGIGSLTGASTGTVFDVAIGTTTNSLTGTVLGDTRCQTPTVSLTGADASLMIPSVRVSIASTTTYYLIVQETFTVGSPAAYGRISARRVR